MSDNQDTVAEAVSQRCSVNKVTGKKVCQRLSSLGPATLFKKGSDRTPPMADSVIAKAEMISCKFMEST